MISIIEGPSPEFVPQTAIDSTILGGTSTPFYIFSTELRTFDADKLVSRCVNSWKALDLEDLNYIADQVTLAQGKNTIVAIKKEIVNEGEKVVLWVKV